MNTSNAEDLVLDPDVAVLLKAHGIVHADSAYEFLQRYLLIQSASLQCRDKVPPNDIEFWLMEAKIQQSIEELEPFRVTEKEVPVLFVKGVENTQKTDAERSHTTDNILHVLQHCEQDKQFVQLVRLTKPLVGYEVGSASQEYAENKQWVNTLKQWKWVQLCKKILNKVLTNLSMRRFSK